MEYRTCKISSHKFFQNPILNIRLNELESFSEFFQKISQIFERCINIYYIEDKNDTVAFCYHCYVSFIFLLIINVYISKLAYRLEFFFNLVVVITASFLFLRSFLTRSNIFLFITSGLHLLHF